MLKIIPSFVFVVLLFVGFRIADQKPLWNDEIYSQLASVEQLSYSQIMMGKVGEGNVSPFFYLGQKLICAVMQYHSPSEWQKGTESWGFDRPMDRFVLRVGPVFVTALAGTLMFWYFLRYYSLLTALFSLFLLLSCEMFLRYWAEARPYALWFFLTTAQGLLFLYIMRAKDFRPKIILGLAVVHIILSFTVVLSLLQIVLVSFLLWIYGFRKWGRYIFLLILPVLIGFTYYSVSPKYPFALIFSFEQYIRANISRDRIYIVMLFMIFLFSYVVQKRIKLFCCIEPIIKEGVPALVLFLGMVASACAILTVFKIKEGPIMQFPVTEKYLIYLAPVGVITVAILADVLIRSVKVSWMQFVFWVVIAGLVISRFSKVTGDFLKQYPHFFS